MNTGGHDRGFDHDLEAESKFSISGKTTPSGASYIPQVLEAEEEVTASYEWGERGVTLHDMPSHEARQYIADATGRSANAQPAEKLEDSNYYTKAPHDARANFICTSLPNPDELRVDGEIDAGIHYQDGILGLSIEFDTEYVHEGADEEISEGSIRFSYAEPFKRDAENEFERTRAALDQLDRLESLLE